MSFNPRPGTSKEKDYSKETGKINIYLRVKNGENSQKFYRIEDNEIHCCMPAASMSNQVPGETVTKTYSFSRIFGPDSSQEDIFNLIIKPKILKFINGKNTTFMSYGASGSGKTFTLMGTAAAPGIIPRTLEYLFKTLQKVEEIPLLKPTDSGGIVVLNQICKEAELKLKSNLLRSALNIIGEKHIIIYKQMKTRLSAQFGGLLDCKPGVILNLWVSFAEIYNENIYDLLAFDDQTTTNARPKLRLVSLNENTYIKNLTNISISSEIEAYQILHYGLHKLSYASTAVNARSSRSHCIFTVKIAQTAEEEGGAHCLRYFNFCDLAGSERLKKTLNVDVRLKESNNINTSLFVLGRCISTIRESQQKKIKKPIPFRDSKLTQLFQKGLSGHESFNMIVNMNASIDMWEESQHVLNFSAIAKDIVVKCAPPALEKDFPKFPQARSTAYDYEKGQPQRPSKQGEITEFENEVIDLYNRLEHTTQNLFNEEDRIRDEMNAQYADIIDELRERLRRDLMCAREKHQKELQIEKASLGNDKKNSDDSEIIIISSSEESDEEDENVEYILKYSELQNELTSRNEKIHELTQILEDIESSNKEKITDYKIKLENLLSENIDLKEKNSKLEAQTCEYRKML